MRSAVVDVGSNSVLPLVAEFDDSGWRTVFESSAVTGLGTGLGGEGRLQPAAMSRTLAAAAEAVDNAVGVGGAEAAGAGEAVALSTATAGPRGAAAGGARRSRRGV